MASTVTASQQGLDMQIIRSYEDATPFAGRMVAYTTQSIYFGGHDGYQLNGCNFAYIKREVTTRQSGERGYQMLKLIKPGDLHCTRALIPTFFDKTISMRFATESEVQFIKKAITAGEAQFDYEYDREVMLEIVNHSLQAQVTE